MALVVGVARDGVRIPLSAQRVAAIARATLKGERVRDALLSVTFVSREAMRTMNHTHLGRDRATDVIAFSFRTPPIRSGRGARAIVGDVYIAPEIAAESARALGVPVREELTRLVVHGTLHVLGHEHPETGDRTRSAMWKKQERLVQRLMRGAGS
jgi:probable rRNA maturation factor